jgi:hypothetical protein
MKRHAFPLVITATLASLVLAGCGEDEPTGADDPASTPAVETSDPATPTSDQPVETQTTTVAPPATGPVPVFFVADTPQGPRLFAEQREVAADNPPAGSLDLLMQGDVADPDYHTVVPAGSLETDAGFDGIGDDGFYSLNLTGEQWTTRPDGMSQADVELALQQIVYTLLSQAGDGEEEGMNGGVDFYLDGDRSSYLGVSGTVAPLPELEVRGFVNVSSPAEGETVSGSFIATGEASSFEATVPWQVRTTTGDVVLEGFTTAEGFLDHLWPFEAEVDVSDLEPGEYIFVAMTDDPSGGEGPGPTEDTKTIVVE